jgi:hypothetical protein
MGWALKWTRCWKKKLAGEISGSSRELVKLRAYERFGWLDRE